jgi:cobalt/nickel transport system permease protein
MHIPDAVLAPSVVATTSLIGSAGLLYGLRKLESQLGDRTTVLMGTMGAFVFAAQMVNFPVGPGVSGHLLGGVLSAVMLGPWAGAVVIGAVLIVQCFLFMDGGLTALGANFINMGLIGSVVGYAIYEPIRRAIGGRQGILLGSMLAAWFSVLLAAGAFAIELAASGRRSDFFQILSWMALVHAAIGVGEAIITGLVVRFVVLARPDMIYDPETAQNQGFADANEEAERPRQQWVPILVGGLAIALAVAVFLAPFASEHPDGLEYVGQKLGFLREDESVMPPRVPAPMPDYQLELPVVRRFSGLDPVKTATALAGIVGTLSVFASGWMLARVFSRPGQGVADKGATVDAV